jgi:polyhydroxybutyrate depolymerase
MTGNTVRPITAAGAVLGLCLAGNRGASQAMTLSRQTLEVEAQQRGFLLAEPTGPPTAVILSLHGTRSNARQQARLSRFDALASAAGVAVVFPQAGQPIGRGFEWDPAVDMSYLSTLVDHLNGRFPSAGGTVAMTGMSGGARMSCHFAAFHADVVSVVGAVAGLRGPGPNPLSRPVPILAFHGTFDRINPYDGNGTSRWNESVPLAAGQWAVANGGDGRAATVEISRHVTQTSYGSPGAANETVLWTVKGGGHTWPGSPLGLLMWLLLGKTTTEIDASKLILASPHLSRAR